MSQPRTFPTIEGGCCCGLIRYRLLSPPLYCYACHCSDCKKESGSVFSSACTIEFDRVIPISKTPPQIVYISQHRHKRIIATCPNCRNILWNTGSSAPQTYNVHVGTLDMPGLMEPDMHIFTADKVAWVKLPEGAKTMSGDLDRAKVWPKGSLVRLEAAMTRFETRRRIEEEKLQGEKEKGEVDGIVDGAVDVAAEEDVDEEDRTPTNGSPEEKDDEVGDEDYERRYTEVEKALQDRLAKLTLKLNEQDEDKA